MAVTHHARHTITVDAPARTVYDIVADAADWPRVFPPSVHVERTPLGDGEEALRIWATANDEVKHWQSRRWLDPEALTVAFRQERTTAPATSMGGRWQIRALSDGRCEVVLLHDFTAQDDDPGNVEWINRALDRNSEAELSRMKATAESAGELGELLCTFEDRVRIEAPIADVHAFLWRGEQWQDRLPHVARVKLSEPEDDIQVLEMDTLAKDGSRHTTESVRVSLGPSRIVYKQLRVPPLLTAHVGEWLLEEADGGTTAVARHTVVINPSSVTLLGPDTTVAGARTFIRETLGANSLATLRHAKEFTEPSPAR
uniref:START domain family cyclase n=1 Tax=Streptomyces sp. FXJ8.102 TaxID=1581323 RepID=A0A7L4WPI5_9ACTN|nr:START domain family cyclase [Streptomyces sp. FXJ8.102]